MSKRVKIGLIQMSCGDDLEANHQKMVAQIKTAVSQDAKIICTQELYKSPYFCQTADTALFELAETLDENNATIKELSALAGELDVVIIASLFEKRAAGLYHNTAVVLDADGRYLGKYRKMHIPEDPHYYEKFYFTPGDLGYKAFQTKYAKIGVLICWDQWFPEAARLTAMRGAEIIFYPTAIGFTPAEKASGETTTYEAWEVVQRGHAVANGCYVAAINRIGSESSPDGSGSTNFWGQSFVANPYGQIETQASADQEDLLLFDIDLALIEESRNDLAHFFRDRRIDSYAPLTKRYLDGE
ncbi:MAG: carbon-nitrogen hydrolase [Chloroflexi bacterium]|nr:carbon-nitrogen hydrolase [Chloroflexota bacterium]